MNYKAHYDRLIERAKTREKPDVYTEDHHIIPRCIGGTDDPENLVSLTAEEHLTAHLLLAKIHKDKPKLWMAARLMCANLQGNRPKNKSYSWWRNKVNSLLSDAVKEKWARKYGFEDYLHQCEEVFNSFLEVGTKRRAGVKFGMSEANSIRSVNFWIELTGQEELAEQVVRQTRSQLSKKIARNSWDDEKSKKTRLEASKRQNRKDRMSVSVDGVIYESIAQTAKILKCGETTVRRRCNNPNFPNWFIVDTAKQK